nr:uncharacterized protein LOC113809812 [Penaeus vannamei]
MDELQPPPSVTSPGGGNTSSSSSTVTRRSTHSGATDPSGSKVVEPVPPPKPREGRCARPRPRPTESRTPPAYETIYFQEPRTETRQLVGVQRLSIATLHVIGR